MGSKGNVYNDDGKQIGYGDTNLVKVDSINDDDSKERAWREHRNGERKTTSFSSVIDKMLTFANPSYINGNPELARLLNTPGVKSDMWDELIRSNYQSPHRKNRAEVSGWFVMDKTTGTFTYHAYVDRNAQPGSTHLPPPPAGSEGKIRFPFHTHPNSPGVAFRDGRFVSGIPSQTDVGVAAPAWRNSYGVTGGLVVTGKHKIWGFGTDGY
ncbi:hypothetical protein [Aliiroseovarius lamellibrachiae]|uniref:hypothetical protein n=1 Tax=Aliiroseovarius lamellibrachiae TaxID=1924933 RepID=UPI001BE10B00|nr:hypothetical protein [Aliiroseovarius lamellibrachiae]MBT2132630.1 hypothetical protein [Aliiroseovarius lamellibrachiae]